MMRQQNGFTIIELLVAAALTLILLTALFGMLQSSLRAYEVQEINATRQENKISAIELLQYEIGLAGYKGTTETDYTSNATLTSPFLLSSGTGNASDTVTVKYYEDRKYGPKAVASLQTVAFTTTSGNLTRTINGNSQPVAADVTQLKLLRYVTKGAAGSGNDCYSVTSTTQCPSTPPSGTVGVVLQLTFSDKTSRRVLVSFYNPVI
jgi:prepilin-type N-terminal cleavage/methylation domain-containing protein